MKPREKRWLGWLSAGFGGIANGLLGTGGGMIMVLALSRLYPAEEKKMVAISTACTLVFSVLTIILYIKRGYMQGVSLLPLLVPSLLGGALGALLLGRIGSRLLYAALAALLLFGGVRLLF